MVKIDSSISHIGFLLLALVGVSQQSVQAFLFYLSQYSLLQVNFFFIVVNIGHYLQNKGMSSKLLDREHSPFQFISQLKGYFYHNPVLSISFAITLLSLAGVHVKKRIYSQNVLLNHRNFSSSARFVYIYRSIYIDKTTINNNTNNQLGSLNNQNSLNSLRFKPYLVKRKFSTSTDSIMNPSYVTGFIDASEKKKPLVVFGTNLQSTVGEKFTRKELTMVKLPPYLESEIVGLLLSDGWLNKSQNSKNARFGFKQALSKSAYVWFVFNILSHYCSSSPRLTSGIRAGKRFMV